jgi:hypothetical protein
VMITLYLWIRAHDFIFETPDHDAQRSPAARSQNPAPTSASSHTTRMRTAIASDD